MVPRAERAELQPPVARVVGRVELCLRRAFLEVRDPGFGRLGDPGVVVTCRQGDRAFDADPECRQVTRRDLVLRELGAQRDHAAADVDADGRRDDRTERRDDRTDGRALSEVGVGHQRQMRIDEGQRRGGAGLVESLLVQDARPRDEPLAEVFHDSFQSGVYESSDPEHPCADRPRIHMRPRT